MTIEVRLRVAEDGTLSGFVRDFSKQNIKKLEPTKDKKKLREEVAKALSELEAA